MCLKRKASGIRRLGLVAAAALGVGRLAPAPGPAGAALRQVRVVAVSATPAAGTALEFGTAFDTRDIYLSPAGEVLFGAPLAGAVFDYGFWRWSSAGTTLIARHGAAAPGAAGFYDFSNGQSRFGVLTRANTHGLMTAQISGGRGLWVGSGATLTRIAEENVAAPMVTDGLFASVPQSLATRPVFNGAGVVFIATLKDGPAPGSPVTSENDTGIWAGDAAAGLQLVAREDQLLPGLPGQKFANFGRPILTPEGVVWFTANTKAPISNDGLFRWSPGDGLSLVYQRSDFGTISKITVSLTGALQFIATTPAPVVTRLISQDPLLGPLAVATLGEPSPDRAGDPSGPAFAQFLHHILPATRRTVLLATTSAGWRGIWREDLGVLKLRARNGDPAVGMPGSQTLLSITQVVANDDGTVAFEATTSGTAGVTGWWRIDAFGTVKPLLLPGDQVQIAPGDIRTVTTVKGSIANGGNPSELGTGYDGVPTHMNREEILLQLFFNNFASSALVLAQGAEFLVVNSTGDLPDQAPGDGVCDTGRIANGQAECTLRAAVMEANALDGPNTIRFDIPENDAGFAAATGAWTIATPMLPVPDLTGSTVVDARTQPGYAGVPRIILDGRGTQSDEHSGFTLEGGSSSISGFSIFGYEGHGVSLHGGGGHHVFANYLGVLPDGLTAPGNERSGLEIWNTAGNTIGGTAAAERNIIAGNGLVGGTSGYNVHLLGAMARDNVISGNWIGLGADGRTPLGGRSGLYLEDAPDNVIGGGGVGARNVISGNSIGIDIAGAAAAGNTILGNLIGLTADGLSPAPNTAAGIRVSGAPHTTIGGPADVLGAPPGNVISGNRSNTADVHAVNLRPRSVGTVIQGNLIGTDASGAVAIPNGGDGIHARDSDSLSIGALDERGRNVISGNDSSGVVIELGRGHRLYSNVVGLRRDLSGALPNAGDGVDLTDTPHADLYGNIVGANGGYGIVIRGAASDSIVVERNVVGTDPFFGHDFGNGRDGIRIGDPGAAGPEAVRLGGDDPALGNTIHFNAGAGLRIAAGMGHRVRGGSFHRNDRLGIDLLGPGITPNDPDDADTGPNALQNFPLLTRAGIDTATGVLRVRGVMVGARKGTLTIDIYGSPECDPDGFGEGHDWLGAVDVTLDDKGAAPIDRMLPLPGGPAAWPAVVTATATSPEGTSEFSACVAVERPDRSGDALTVNARGDASDLNPGDGICSTGGTVGAHPECTLRAALEEAAALPGGQAIDFAIPGAAPWIIRPSAPLPAVAEVALDATTQPGYGSHPVVALDGALLAGGAGLTLAGAATLSGLAVINAPGDGLHLTGSGNMVRLCDVGIDPATGAPAPNGGHGVRIEGSNGAIGAAAASGPNRIAHNFGDGIRVVSGHGNAISGNAIFANGGLGINLAGGIESAAGVTENDAGDADDGANALQNRPLLTGAGLRITGDVAISGVLSSVPNTTYRLEFFVGDACDPSGAGEGDSFLGTSNVTTDGDGAASFALVLDAPPPASAPRQLTATATDPDGNSSEFSDCLALGPVSVALLDFTAHVDSGWARLSWAVTDDPGLLGFRVWRRAVRASLPGDWDLRAGELVRALSHAADGSRRHFHYEDAWPPSEEVVDYRLEAILRDGTSEILGPFSVTPAPPMRVALHVVGNPVVRHAEIVLELPVAGALRLTVHDVGGRLRRLLVDGPHPAGRVALGWDLRDDAGARLPSGLYFLKLEAGGERRTARVVITR